MHWRLEKLAADMSGFAIEHFATRTVRLRGGDRYISFSFDDCPRSATTTGRAILERAGVRATFYLAGGLANSRDSNPASFESRTVPELHATGHEIACHTFDHARVSEIGAAGVIDQIRRNRSWLNGVLPGCELESFSYPFGATSLAAKRAVGAHFRSARSTLEGVNTGSIDLLLLKAARIYERLGNARELLELIETVRHRGGWLIFYTHDVDEHPSAYGCTPRTFGEIVDAATASGCTVLPVRDVVRSIAPP